VQIGPKTLKNRFCQVPQCTHFGTDLAGSHAYHRGIKAEGGWALVNTEYCSIHPESDDYPRNYSRLWDDADVRNLSVMCDAVHEHDALAGVELWYGAAHAANLDTRTAARGVAQVAPYPGLPGTCYEVTIPEIRELQQFFVDAALRARQAGFDVMNVYGGHAESITGQFFSRFYNKRTDQYGGSFENRARFWRECIELVREAVGDSCAIAARHSVDDRGQPAIDRDDALQFIELVDDLVDFWDLVVGTGEAFQEDIGPSRTHPENHEADAVRRARAHTKKPIIGVGRFVSPDVMVEAIRSGQLDIIGAARPSIADPFLPRKIEEGRLGDIRECIGCNICVASTRIAARLTCTQNATAGEEYRRGWHPERFDRARNADKDVVVVGAGPAGLECARVLGERGMHRVHLLDRSSDLGGHLGWVSRLPGLGQWHRVVDYRKIQLEKLKNVEVILNAPLTKQEILEYGAEIVVLATGSHWAADGLNPSTQKAIPGAEAPRAHVLTPEQIMVDGAEVPGDQVVIYDTDGYYVAVGIAERLASQGKQVTIVTSLNSVAPFLEHTGEATFVYTRLYDLGVQLLPERTVTRVADDHVQLAHHYDSRGAVDVPTSAVVLVTQRNSDDALYRELTAEPERLKAEGIEGVYRTGDCLVPRYIRDSIFDGHRLAREIDSDNPMIPLPHIREHRVLTEDQRAPLETR
jgi:dimethylamine/trimethylamine dehydrogenase